MKEKFRIFMSGRYGVDELSKAYLAITAIMIIASMITKLTLFYIAGLALLIYMYLRMFSRDISKMSSQNRKYIAWRDRQSTKLNNAKQRFLQRKTHHFFRCPECKQKVRVPRGKGKISITCPVCKTAFLKIS